jgi:hypothetical protein
VTTYRMTWPVNDPRVPLAVLIGQAQYDLSAALASMQLQPAGRPTWQIEHCHGPRLTVEMPVVGDHVLDGAPPCQTDRDIDEIALERFIAGDLDWRLLTIPERIEAGIRMQRNGYSRNEIHARCHVNQQQLTAALNAARDDDVSQAFPVPTNRHGVVSGVGPFADTPDRELEEAP